jgi:hypothetical protein
VLPEVTAIRYVTPLREGGSLPGLMEADDSGTYVVKFHGAGQGRKALIAEVICARLARGFALPVPDLVVVDVDPALAAGEPDEEIQDLLRASPGHNLGVDFLPGALDFDAGAFEVDAELAGRVIWFDALIGNVDRSWRNPNVLYWHGQLQLIDHGAALTFHHNWPAAGGFAQRPYDATQHALIGCRPDLVAAEDFTAALFTDELLDEAVADVPDEWLSDEPGFDSPDAVREAYRAQLGARYVARTSWLAALGALAEQQPARTTPTRNRPSWLGGA